jgi:predicted site-specific integrase-resolvase
VEQLEQWALGAPTGTLTLPAVGSGPSTDRRHLVKSLALVQDNHVAEVVVTFADRLTRFGVASYQTLFSGIE